MALPKMIQVMLLTPITNLTLQAYQQGKEDSEKGEYDEASFKKQFKDVIKKNLR